MRPARCSSLSTTWTAAALLALLGCVVAAPAPAAAASCAVRHYLADPESGLVTAGLEALAGPLSAPVPTSETPAPAPTPCGSWRCQQGAPAAPVPLSPIPSAQGELWGVLADGRSAASSREAGRCASDETSPRPIRRPGAVFHPPR